MLHKLSGFKTSITNTAAKRFLKYSSVVLSGTIIDFSVLLLLVEFFSLNVLVANSVSFLLAVINNYILNRIWTFEDKNKKIAQQFSKFVCVSVVGFAINFFLMATLLRFGIWYVIAKTAVIVVVLIWNFSMNSFWTFKK